MFGTHGFAAVFTDDLVNRLGMSRGALYHHFRTKEDLFVAVFEDVEAELVESVLSAGEVSELESWEQLRTGLQAYLDLCVDPIVSRILFVEGPAVLGWDAWYEMDERYAFGHIVAILQMMIDDGLIDDVPVVPLANVVFGALTRAGLTIAQSPQPRKARAETGQLLDRIIDGLAGKSVLGRDRRRSKGRSRRGGAP